MPNLFPLRNTVCYCTAVLDQVERSADIDGDQLAELERQIAAIPSTARQDRRNSNWTPYQLFGARKSVFGPSQPEPDAAISPVNRGPRFETRESLLEPSQPKSDADPFGPVDQGVNAGWNPTEPFMLYGPGGEQPEFELGDPAPGDDYYWRQNKYGPNNWPGPGSGSGGPGLFGKRDRS
ncbi:hypothetical protein TWF718_008513 [Orbilia javanica]|uniref:Uncharacterized protein n=1 Tax=Orbilia javanica TaxID=47235 RepID=A0AAN8N175_9PEZI